MENIEEKRLAYEAEMNEAYHAFVIARIKELANDKTANGECKTHADKYVEAETKRDALGKVIQSLEGNGSMEDPYKGWKVGMTVEADKWYMTEGGYLWQAIKSGTPSSETDNEYFDVVGID